MKNLLFVLIGCFIGIALTRLILQLEIDTSMQYAIEKAYYEGQKDALNGVIGIEKNSDSVYVWKKSSKVILLYDPLKSAEN